MTARLAARDGITCSWCAKALVASASRMEMLRSMPPYARQHDTCRAEMLAICERQILVPDVPMPAGRAGR